MLRMRLLITRIVLSACFVLSVLLLRICVLFGSVSGLACCVRLITLARLTVVLMAMVWLYVLPLRVLVVGIILDRILTIILAHVLVVFAISILLFVGLLIQLLFTVLVVALLVVCFDAALLVLHLHLFLLSQLLILLPFTIADLHHHSLGR